MVDHNVVASLLKLGYRDYIASRVLLNRGYIIQGVVLASTAVEKYLKIAPALEGFTPEIHLTEIKRIKGLYHQINNELFKYLDPSFLKVLSDAYRLRYYDKIHKPLIVGFFVGQFLGELDYTVAAIEYLADLSKVEPDGSIITIDSDYQQAVKAKMPDLYENNYVLNRLDKKNYMEQPDTGYVIIVDKDAPGCEIGVRGKNIVNSYEGRIALINVKYE